MKTSSQRTIHFAISFGVAILGFGLLVCRSANAQQTELLQQLYKSGIQVPDAGNVPLPPPTLRKELSKEQTTAALKKLSGGAGWKRFSRNSAVAPIKIDLDYIKDDNGNRLGHQIHIAFVVHASMQTLRDKDLMKQMFGDPKRAKESRPDGGGAEVSAGRLKELGIDANEESKFYEVEFPLLDKVLAKGVLHVEQANSDDAFELVFHLDERFNEGAEPQNAWATIKKNEPDSKRRFTLTSRWKPYGGAGGYISVQPVPDIEGACLMEARIVMHEPSDWFNSSTLLRSKLPLLMQEGVRSFRRKLPKEAR